MCVCETGLAGAAQNARIPMVRPLFIAPRRCTRATADRASLPVQLRGAVFAKRNMGNDRERQQLTYRLLRGILVQMTITTTTGKTKRATLPGAYTWAP